MIITLEQVENLKAHANVSYGEAKEALEATGGDLLEAMIYLEKAGKVKAPENGGIYTLACIDEKEQSGEREHAASGDEEFSFGEQMGKLWNSFCKLVKKGNVNHFEVYRTERRVMSVPVNLLVLAALFFFWFTIPAMVVGLFCGCTYRFNGPDLGKDGINNVMDSASDTAEGLKNSFRSNEK